MPNRASINFPGNSATSTGIPPRFFTSGWGLLHRKRPSGFGTDPLICLVLNYAIYREGHTELVPTIMIFPLFLIIKRSRSPVTR